MNIGEILYSKNRNKKKGAIEKWKWKNYSRINRGKKWQDKSKRMPERKRRNHKETWKGFRSLQEKIRRKIARVYKGIRQSDEKRGRGKRTMAK